MTDTLEVYIDYVGKTRLVGRCRFAAKAHQQSSVFEYAEEWLSFGDAFALDPANLPLSENPTYLRFHKSALPGAIRDTAPDRWGRQLIRRALRKSGERRFLSELDFLLAIDDHSRIGALRFKREGELSFNHDTGRYRMPPLNKLPALLNAADAVQSNTESAEQLKLLLHEGSPLGGARPKSAVVDRDGQLIIAKFPKPDDDRSIPHGEILALTLANKAGINAARGRLQTVAGRPVALIRRFDRVGDYRVPYLSAMSLLGLNDSEFGTYTDIAECIRMYSFSPLEDLHELWRRMVFSVLISNLDDHLRNHGFIYVDDGKWRLSPAFDLNPVPIEEKVRELTTWISEEGPDASVDLLRSAAPFFALKDNQAQQIIADVLQVVSLWRSTAQELGMSKADIAAYASAFEDV